MEPFPIEQVEQPKATVMGSVGNSTIAILTGYCFPTAKLAGEALASEPRLRFLVRGMGDDRAMQDWPMPLKAALTVAAVAWPFLAGLGIVLWSRARAAKRVQATSITRHSAGK